jgi:hypothetical protein
MEKGGAQGSGEGDKGVGTGERGSHQTAAAQGCGGGGVVLLILLCGGGSGSRFLLLDLRQRLGLDRAS